MKTILILGLLLTACIAAPVPDPEEPAFIGPIQTEIMATEFAPTQIPPTSTPEPAFQRTSWLLLGGDYRAHREGTGWGNKTDVIVLVSVLETDPMQITVVQFPRNLYHPFSYGDVWLFGVWDEYGWQGLHQYFQEVFGISLQGIHYINMDGFVKVVDEIGGIRVSDGGGAYQLGGEDVLSYLRDNENNWGMGSYDAQERVFGVLNGLWMRGQSFFLSDPIAATNAIYSRWGDLFESDLGNIEQLYWLFRLGWRVRNADLELNLVQLEEPTIVRGDTLIFQDKQPMRGMVADTDLREWMSEVLNVQG
jgi:hypothetical protein